MKNVFKLLGIIALVAVIGFSFAACDDGSGEPDKPGGGTKTTVTSIAVTTPPTKTSYTVGEALSTAGMVVTATYSDGTKAPVSDYETSGFSSTTPGNKTVTVTYQTKTATFMVTVLSIPIVTTPTASPAGGTLVSPGTLISLATPTDGAEIWYTTNGSTPAKNGAGSTRYTAPFAITTLPLTLKAIAVKDGWTDSGVLEAEYSTTHITVADIDITAAAKGATPPRAVSNPEQERFTCGPVTWSSGGTAFTDSQFLGLTVYTATVTLTAKPGYTFEGINPANVKIGRDVATVVSNTGDTITLSYEFPRTREKAVSSIEITSPITKMIYTHGDFLDLTGLVVTLTFDDGTTEAVPAASFTDITTVPAHGIPLEHTTYDGEEVTISFGDLTESAGDLTVDQKDVADAEVEVTGIVSKTYNGGTAITQTLTVKQKVVGSERNMVLGDDYTVAYDDNHVVGTAKITISGIGDYTGTKVLNFAITKANPVTTWPIASTINYQQALSSSNLTNSQAAAGNFAWVAPTTVPPLGKSSQSVKFTPTDGDNYNEQTSNVEVTVIEAPITTVNISITAPVKNVAPSTTVSSPEPERFTQGTVSWDPPDNPFKPSTVYKATVTLTEKAGYTFNNYSATPQVNGSNATIVNNTTTALTLSYTFGATAAKTVTGMSIKTQQTKVTYIHGETLDLTDLVVTLTYDSGDPDDIPYTDFTGAHITAVPAHGTPLERDTYNGEPVTIKYGGQPDKTTGTLTINQKDIGSDITVAAIAAQTYTGSAITPTLTVEYPVFTGTKRTLVSPADYTVDYNNTNKNAGTATGTLSGHGDYTGTKGVTFTINPKPLSESGVDAVIDPTSDKGDYSGENSGVEPDVIVTFAGETLVKGTHYTLSYSNNTSEGQNARITITAIANTNYSGSTHVYFTTE